LDALGRRLDSDERHRQRRVCVELADGAVVIVIVRRMRHWRRLIGRSIVAVMMSVCAVPVGMRVGVPLGMFVAAVSVCFTEVVLVVRVIVPGRGRHEHRQVGEQRRKGCPAE
jgi:hypothetical protein